MNKTLAIIGSHPRTRELFDYSRTDCDVWMFNEALSGKNNEWAKRADVIFQMHLPAIWRNPANRNDPGHFEWLRTQDQADIYMMEAYSDVPRSRKYPLEGVLSLLNGDPDHFLSSSVPQAMALAAYFDTYDRIEIYGVAMETNTEYQFQREGVAFWKGFLMGKGIEVYFADPTFRCLLYGYEGDVTLPYDTFAKRMVELAPEISRLNGEYQAAAHVMNNVIAGFVDHEATPEIQSQIQTMLALSKKLGVLGGQIQENERYQERADKMKEAADGEFIFSRQEFESAAKNLSDRAQDALAQVNILSGQGDLLHQTIVQAAKNSPKRKKILGSYGQLLTTYLKAHNQAMIFSGAAQENFRYMAELDKMVRAAGGTKAEEVLLEQMKASPVVVEQ